AQPRRNDHSKAEAVAEERHRDHCGRQHARGHSKTRQRARYQRKAEQREVEEEGGSVANHEIRAVHAEPVRASQVSQHAQKISWRAGFRVSLAEHEQVACSEGLHRECRESEDTQAQVREGKSLAMTANYWQ